VRTRLVRCSARPGYAIYPDGVIQLDPRTRAVPTVPTTPATSGPAGARSRLSSQPFSGPADQPDV